jgi:hypothetical protein
MSDCNAVLLPKRCSGVILPFWDVDIIALFARDDCTGESLMLYESGGDLCGKSFNDRARSFLVTPQPSFHPRSIPVERDIKI